MTPEAAKAMGFELTKSSVLDWLSLDGELAGLLQETEDNVSGDSETGALDVALVPHAIRGAAAFYAEVARELEARAAALEATR